MASADLDLDRILRVLGHDASVPYAPPNIYPMSAPKFVSSPCLERSRPSGEMLSVYAHVPFCNYACTFCFYAKRVGDDARRMDRYVKALRRELKAIEPGTRLAQLYVGGGTPTALPPALLDEALGAVLERTRSEADAVHTVESSPESITPEHVEALRRHAIRRVSLGIQSLSEGVLDAIHRRHTGDQALAACDLLVGGGFLVSVDLIYGLPGQDEAGFRRDFESVARRGVHAVTAYNLRVNERTPVVKVLREEERLDLARRVRWRGFVNATARELGFLPVRWHSFARASLTSAREREQAAFDDASARTEQFGAGLSARSRFGSVVYRNHVDFDEYLARVESGRSPVEESFSLDEGDRRIRFIGQSLGDGKPLARAAYARSFGRAFDEEFGAALGRLRDAGLIEDVGEEIHLSENGRLVYDLVVLAFYPDSTRGWMAERQQAAFARAVRH